MKKQLLFAAGCILSTLLSTQVTISLNPDKDAMVGFHDGYPTADANYGDDTGINAFSQPAAGGPGENAGWGLFSFDLSDIPAGATVQDATLDLFARGSEHTGENASWLSRITEDWDEYTVTWNTKPDITDVDQVELLQSTSPDQDYPGIDVKALIQYFVDHPDENFGFALHLQVEEPTRLLIFASTNFDDDSKWPLLHVTYTTQAAIWEGQQLSTITVFPNPAYGSVFIAGNETNEISDLTIYNSVGEIVFRTSAVLKNSGIDVSKLPAGIYMIRIINSSRNETISTGFIKD